MRTTYIRESERGEKKMGDRAGEGRKMANAWQYTVRERNGEKGD